MKNSLAKQCPIQRENLSEQFYLHSLLQEACKLHLLTSEELENIQIQSAALLADQVKYYTRGDSSSVRIETAQNILQSSFYTIGLYLKDVSDISQSLELLKEKSLSSLIAEGKVLLKKQLEASKMLLNDVQNTKISTLNIEYNYTMDSGLSSFFSLYDMSFEAHDTPADIDYPLSCETMHLSGCEFMHHYLSKLLLENKFCSHFDSRKIHTLLLGYDKDYEELLINIFDLVLVNAIGCILSEQNPLELSISSFDNEYLQSKFQSLSGTELEDLLLETASQLFKFLEITDDELKEYILSALRRFLPRLRNALNTHSLSSVFITPITEKESPSIKLQSGKQMEDDAFKVLVHEIRECRYTSDKITIIQKNIHHYLDLTDLLESACLFDDEYAQFFDSLGNPELALIFKQLPSEMDEAALHFTEDEQEWHHALISYLQKAGTQRLQEITALSEAIQIDEPPISF